LKLIIVFTSFYLSKGVGRLRRTALCMCTIVFPKDKKNKIL
jgi:hypothetical protein